MKARFSPANSAPATPYTGDLGAPAAGKVVGAVAAAVTLVLTGCGSSPPDNSAAPPAPMHEANVTLVPAPGCADGWTVAIDRDSFASNGAGKTFDADRLDAFSQSIDVAAKEALAEACEAGDLDPALVAATGTLTVVSASGAADPVFTATALGKARLEHAFAEHDLVIPSQMELRAGLACWMTPAAPGCTALEP